MCSLRFQASLDLIEKIQLNVFDTVLFLDGGRQLTRLETSQQLDSGLSWMRQTQQEGQTRLDYEFR